MHIAYPNLLSAAALAALTVLLPVREATAIGEPVFGTVRISGHNYGSSSNALPGTSPQPEFRVLRHNSDEPFDTLAPDQVTITGSFLVQMKKGFVTGYDIGFQFIDPTNVRDLVHGDSNLWEGVPGISDNFSFTISPTSLSANFQQKIIDACNTATMSDGEAQIDFPVAIQVKAHRYKRGNTSANKRRDKVATGFVRSKVLCGTIAQVTQPPRPGSIDLRVKSLDDICPQKTEVRAFIDYTEPTTASFRFRHNGNLSEHITIKARKVTLAGKTFYRIERVKYYSLNPGTHNFHVEVNGGARSDVSQIRIQCAPFQATSMWLTLSEQNSLTCPKVVTASVRINGNRPGAVLTKIRNQAGVIMAIESIKVKREGNSYIGRFSTQFTMNAIDTMLIAESANDPTSNSGWQPLEVACPTPLKGTLTFRDDNPRQCPRQASAAIAIQTGAAGMVSYRLDCTGGRSWSGNVMARQTGAATFLATDTRNFAITRNEHLSCALKSVESGRSQTLTLGGHQFQCTRPSGVAAGGSMAMPPRSSHSEPTQLQAVGTRPTRTTGSNPNASQSVAMPDEPCPTPANLPRQLRSRTNAASRASLTSAAMNNLRATDSCKTPMKSAEKPDTNAPSAPLPATMQLRANQ